MLCQECKKNLATVHFTKIVNGNITELHLCEECAKKYKELDLDTSFSFHKFLTGFLDNIQGEQFKVNYDKDIKCNNCGMTYSEFKQLGKFGCPNCYEAFREKITPLFKQIHGHESHIGKIPKRAGGVIGVKKEINKLKNQLDNCVEKEEFEKAAELRDKIKELQEEIDNI
jgi:protein arginine kinase activator